MKIYFIRQIKRKSWQFHILRYLKPYKKQNTLLEIKI